MKQKNSRVVFRIKDGVEPSAVVPNAPLGAESAGGISLKRLHNVGNAVADFRENSPMATAAAAGSNDEVFDKHIYNSKPPAEQKLFRTYTAEGSRKELDDLYKNLRADENVEFVQFDEMNDLYHLPDDPLFGQLWGIRRIDCPTAWDEAKGNTITVAVIDTGVDYEHPDIADRMWTDAAGNFGFDFSDDDPDPFDFHGHGSHCAGTVAATIDNDTGVVGVAPSAKIMALKIFPNAFDTVCAAAIKYAADNGARVLSNSWGPRFPRPSNPVVEDAIDYAVSLGCIVVFAAGNSDQHVVDFSPANHPDVISVAATARSDGRAGFSNFGDSITIAAPGVDILSLKPNTSSYTLMSGTSMACPHIAGVVALLLELNSSLTLDDIKTVLRDNADHILTDKPIGGLRVNAARSVSSVAAGLTVAKAAA